MQTWPPYAKAAMARFPAAASTSASSHTMAAAFPPSSRMTFLRAASSLIFQPTTSLPVKLTQPIRSSVQSGRATSGSAWTRENARFGQPEVSTARASKSAVTGVRGDGFRITGLPAASAGASLWSARLSGKLKGVIAVTGPTGNRRTAQKAPSPRGSMSTGTTSPSNRVASSEASRIVVRPLSSSASAYRRGFPASAMIVSTNSARRASTSSRSRRRTSERRCAGRRRVSSNPAAAAAIARSISAGPAFATRPTSSPDQGDRTSIHSRVVASSPAMRRGRSLEFKAQSPKRPADLLRDPDPFADRRRKWNQVARLPLCPVVRGEERFRAGCERAAKRLEPGVLDDPVAEEGTRGPRNPLRELRPLDFGHERHPRLEVFLRVHQPLRGAVQFSNRTLHRLSQPDGEREEVFVDMEEGGRPLFGRDLEERRELAERRVAPDPGGASPPVVGPGLTERLSGDEPREALDLVVDRFGGGLAERAGEVHDHRFVAVGPDDDEMVREAGETKREKDLQTCGNRPVGREERRGAFRRHPCQVRLPGRERGEETLPARPAGADRVKIEDPASGLLVEGGREIVVEGLERPRRVLDRETHRREGFDRFCLLGVECRAREECKEIMGGARIHPDLDRVLRRRWRLVRSPGGPGDRAGRGRRSAAPQGSGRGEKEESRPSRHTRIAPTAVSTSEKSEKSACGRSAASFSAGVGPVATAIARAPSERPHATSCTESPMMTTEPAENSLPVDARARARAIGGR